MIHNRLGAKPRPPSGFSDAILQLGVFVETAVLSRHSLLPQQAGSFIPQSELIEEELRDTHVAAPDVLEPQQLPLVSVVEQPGIGERALIEPIGPPTKVVRDRNDGSTRMSSSVNSSSGARARAIPAFFPRLSPGRSSHAVLNLESRRHHSSSRTGVSSVEALSMTMTSNEAAHSCAASVRSTSGRY
jgi:hypothetical protein